MLAIQNLQNSLHGHSISAIETLQKQKTLLQQAYKNEEIPQHLKVVIKIDIRRIETLIDWIMGYQIMEEFYQTDNKDWERIGQL